LERFVAVRKTKSERELASGSHGTESDALAQLSEFDGELYRAVDRWHLAESALAVAEARFRDFAEAAADWFWELGPDLRFTHIVGRYHEAMGLTGEQIVGLSCEELAVASPEDQQRWQRHFEDLKARRAFRDFELRWIRPEGDLRVLQISGKPVFDEALQFRGYRGVGRDITEHKLKEQTLRKLSRAVEQSPSLVIITDINGVIQYANPCFETVTGYTQEEVLGQRPSLLQSGITPGTVYADLWHTIKCGGTWRGELLNRRKDGSHYWNIVSISPITDESGNLTHFLGIQTDITERKRAEEALRSSEIRYRALYDDNPSMFFTVDRYGKILSVNHFGAEQLGYDVHALIGAPLTDLHAEHERSMVAQRLESCLQQPGRLHRWEVSKVRSDGRALWVRETARVVLDADGNPSVLMVCEDINDAHQLSEQLSYQASHDALTGLFNRRAFEQRLEGILEAARVGGGEHALCYLDLDQFKVINDTCGHVAGDELLRQLGDLLRHHVRKADTIARLGGDEFAVVMEHCSLRQAERIARQLRAAIEALRFVWEDKSFNIGVSIGLVPICDSSDSTSGLLRAADAACYAAKDAGRNRIHIYHDADSELSRRQGEMLWVARINKALEEDRFQLFFQPIVAVATGECSGLHYELLLRMKEEDGQVVLPGAFLPAAERYNLSPRLDRWVIDAAFAWLTKHPMHLAGLSLCAINLSGHSLGDDDFLEFVIQRFSTSDVPPSKICFEITETAAIANFSRATRFIRALKQLGCPFALDDFGSGLSSFAYLKTLPVDFLKIDGVFVKDLVHDPLDLAMVKSINELGQVMGKRTIAECVENDEILGKLRELGVDYAQGYGVGRPRPLDELR
jgi:diguanylate cyclase (GGDEF)-like protein/PAS domain S-box-containing protein